MNSKITRRSFIAGSAAALATPSIASAVWHPMAPVVDWFAQQPIVSIMLEQNMVPNDGSITGFMDKEAPEFILGKLKLNDVMDRPRISKDELADMLWNETPIQQFNDEGAEDGEHDVAAYAYRRYMHQASVSIALTTRRGPATARFVNHGRGVFLMYTNHGMVMDSPFVQVEPNQFVATNHDVYYPTHTQYHDWYGQSGPRYDDSAPWQRFVRWTAMKTRISAFPDAMSWIDQGMVNRVTNPITFGGKLYNV